MNTDQITVTGIVASDIRNLATSEGLQVTSFRLASRSRRYDRSQQKWVDADTNWYTVACFRQLAVNCHRSLAKGDRVLVSGRLRLRRWSTEEKSGLNVEIEADAVGPDLGWDVCTLARAKQQAHSAESADEKNAQPGSSEAPGIAQISDQEVGEWQQPTIPAVFSTP